MFHNIVERNESSSTLLSSTNVDFVPSIDTNETVTDAIDENSGVFTSLSIIDSKINDQKSVAIPPRLNSNNYLKQQESLNDNDNSLHLSTNLRGSSLSSLSYDVNNNTVYLDNIDSP